MKENIKKAIFVAKKMFTQLVYDFQSLEGMPFTFPEVQTFLQGITIGGHKISDQEKLKQQQLAWQRLIELIEQEKFKLSKKIACELEYIVAKDEALTPGIIRDGAVSVTSGDFTYHPPEPHELPSLFDQTLKDASKKKIPLYERGYNLALDFTWNQFYWDGNKRTGNLMMNGLFMSNGLLPCSVPAARLLEYNTLLMNFYKFHENKAVTNFLKECHMETYLDWKMDFPQS
ncbi:Fic family protein [Desulfobacula sp.]|uniref:Fic family protein n=1 Tax=Desulfobacula sp. TaxID=2593537 RepID=UPI00262B24DF|nr:Fic family protein [Desulfobacula sp.]